jgi:hypothetical protein
LASALKGSTSLMSVSEMKTSRERIEKEKRERGVCTHHVLIPSGVASRLVCGAKTEIPRALSLRRDACSGLPRVSDLRPRKIWRGCQSWDRSITGGFHYLPAGGTQSPPSSRPRAPRRTLRG